MTTSTIISSLLSMHQNESRIQTPELAGALETISLLSAPQSEKAQAKKEPILWFRCIRIQFCISLPGHCSILELHCLHV